MPYEYTGICFTKQQGAVSAVYSIYLKNTTRCIVPSPHRRLRSQEQVPVSYTMIPGKLDEEASRRNRRFSCAALPSRRVSYYSYFVLLCSIATVATKTLRIYVRSSGISTFDCIMYALCLLQQASKQQAKRAFRSFGVVTVVSRYTQPR